jgi:1-acyl-sn-glycerol-3-phosphate acyltransferase
VFAAGGVLGIFPEGRIGFGESSLLPFEDGATAFAATASVPVVPCAIVGSTRLWFRKRIVIRFGAPLATADTSGREARAALERDIREAVERLLPTSEPALPRRQPLRWLTDLLNGPDDIARRRAELGE